MKKTLKSILAMLLVCPLAFAQTAERYSDNNIEYPSFVTDISAEDISTFDSNNYVLESLEIPEYDAGQIQESDSTPTVDEILPSVNPAESFVLTSSSGGGLETFNEEDLQNPSRSVQIAQNQYLDVEYPGKGWIYLGETDNTNMMRYFGHSISADTTFTLRAKSQGTALLHFYKIDPLTGTAINDYLEVVISGKTSSEVHVNAPSYGDIVPSGQRKKTAAQQEKETQAAVEEESPSETQAVATDTGSEDEKSKEPEEPTADLDAVAREIEAPKVEVASTKSTGTSSTKSTGTTSSGSSGSSTKSTGTTSSGSSGSSTKSTGTTSSGSSGSSTKSTGTTSSGSSGSSTKSTGTTSSGSSGSSTKSTGTTSSGSSSSSTKSTGTTSSTSSGSSTKSTGTTSSGGSQSNKNVTSKSDDELLAKAEAAYNKGNYAECLDILTEFFNNAVTKIDEGLYLQGRALEAPGSSRNIKAALDTYETLVKRYPKSKKWNAANERVIYIKRFYFNIR